MHKQAKSALMDTVTSERTTAATNGACKTEINRDTEGLAQIGACECLGNVHLWRLMCGLPAHVQCKSLDRAESVKQHLCGQQVVASMHFYEATDKAVVFPHKLPPSARCLHIKPSRLAGVSPAWNES